MIHPQQPPPDRNRGGRHKQVGDVPGTNQPREGHTPVTDPDQRGETGPQQWMQDMFRLAREKDRVRARHPDYAELERQVIQLRRNGAVMTWGDAQVCLRVLNMLKDKPSLADAWETLLALVRPEDATHLPETVSHDGRALLSEMGIIDENGLDPKIAAVLDASFRTTQSGDIVLTDPVAYTADFVNKWASVESTVGKEFEQVEERNAVEKAKRRRGPSDDGGRSL